MQKGLGKGLGALLGDTSPLSSAPAAEGSGVTVLPIAKVGPTANSPANNLTKHPCRIWRTPSAGTASCSP